MMYSVIVLECLYPPKKQMDIVTWSLSFVIPPVFIIVLTCFFELGSLLHFSLKKKTDVWPSCMAVLLIRDTVRLLLRWGLLKDKLKDKQRR